MIRINLLGTPKPKKSKRAGLGLSAIREMGSGEGPNVVLVAAVLVLLAAAGNGAYYWKLQRQSTKLKADLITADRDFQRLAQVKAKYQEREKQKDVYKRRVDVIDKLRAEQSGPVNLLSMLGTTVSHTDEVWLNNMHDEGGSIKLDGVALSVHAVADLMHNLQSTGYFKSVELTETRQDASVRDMQAFIFTLVCQKQKS